MSIEELFESGERVQNRSHFRNMVMIAKSDGEISEKESELLYRIGMEISLTKDQIEGIIKNPYNFNTVTPVSRTERFEQIVNLIQMVQADGRIDEHEMDILGRIAVGLGYKDIDDVDVESILALINRGEDTEAIIEELL